MNKARIYIFSVISTCELIEDNLDLLLPVKVDIISSATCFKFLWPFAVPSKQKIAALSLKEIKFLKVILIASISR